MAEGEMAHRHAQEKAQMQASINDVQSARRQIARGQYCAVVVCLAILTAAVFIVALGDSVASSVVAGLVGISGIGTVAAVFIWERKPDEARDSERPSSPSVTIPSDRGLPLFDKTKST